MIVARRPLGTLFSSSQRIFESTKNMLCTSATAEVQLESIKDKGIVTLNRPKALNALNLSMIRQIYPTMQSWEKNKCLVLMRGVGDKAFCAGGDVRAVTEAGKSGGSLTQEFFREEYQLNYLIGSFKIPYVAFIHGITMGGGVGLSVHGKYRVATEKTLFAMPETAIGLFPDVGGSYFLPRLQGKLGLYLALTGYRLKGSDVLNAGIATHICHSTNLAQLQQTLINSDASQVDAVLEAFSAKTPELKSQEFSLKPVMSKINEAFSAKSVEEIISNLKKDESKWSQDTLNTLLKMSPTSLKVTFKQLELGATKDLKECLEMEYRMTQKFCAAHDFYEGVRSVLIDRDQNPQWKPNTLEQITQQQVDDYFAPLAEEKELKLKASL